MTEPERTDSYFFGGEGDEMEIRDLNDAEVSERLDKLEHAIFLLGVAVGRLDVLEEAGFKLEITVEEDNG